MMKNKKLSLILTIAAFALCIGSMILITANAFASSPKTAEEITDGRCNDVYGYEEFGDFISTDMMDKILPTHLSKYTYVEMPYGGCMAKRNPISAVDEKGDILYQMKVIQPHVIYVNIDGRCTAYRVIENDTTK